MECSSEDHTISLDSSGAIPKQFGNKLKQIDIAVGTAQVQ